MKQFYFFCLLFLFTSCNRNGTERDESKNQTNSNNKPPSTFTINVDSITDKSAFISWNKATDPENDSIKYDIILDNSLISINNKKFYFKFDKLRELTNYSGRILAKDAYNNSTIVNFNFKTLKYYLKFAKKYIIPNDTYSAGQGLNMLKLNDGNFLIGGYNSNGKFCFLKIDHLGNEIWGKSTNINYHIDFHGYKMIKSRNTDQIIIAGGHYVFKIDIDGNVLWKKEIESYDTGYNNSTIMGLAEDENNDIYVVGQSSGSREKKISIGVLTKLDNTGSIIWEKKYNKTLETYFKDIIIDNQNLIILGQKETSDRTWEDHISNNPQHIQFSLLYTNKEGKELFEKFYPGYFSRGLFKRSTGNLLLYGQVFVNGNNATTIYEVDTKGNIIWNKTYLLGEPKRIREDQNGNLIVIGVQHGYAYTRTYYYSTDNQGNMLWDKNIYNMGTYHMGIDIMPEDDGDRKSVV